MLGIESLRVFKECNALTVIEVEELQVQHKKTPSKTRWVIRALMDTQLRPVEHFSLENQNLTTHKIKLLVTTYLEKNCTKSKMYTTTSFKNI